MRPALQRILFSLLVGCVGGMAHAGHVLAHEDLLSPPTLTVSGEGIVSYPPDKAIVNFSVETAGRHLEAVQEDNDERMERVMRALQKLGVEKEHIQTSSFTVTPQYPPRARRKAGMDVAPTVPKIVGYTVTNSLVVEVLELSIVGRVVDRALDAGANRFSHISWALEDPRPGRLKALQHAARHAQQKALALAKSLNVSLPRVVSVVEGGHQIIPKRHTRGRAMMSMAMDESSSSASVSPGELDVRATVTLVYEISQD